MCQGPSIVLTHILCHVHASSMFVSLIDYFFYFYTVYRVYVNSQLHLGQVEIFWTDKWTNLQIINCSPWKLGLLRHSVWPEIVLGTTLLMFLQQRECRWWQGAGPQRVDDDSGWDEEEASLWQTQSQQSQHSGGLTLCTQLCQTSPR